MQVRVYEGITHDKQDPDLYWSSEIPNDLFPVKLHPTICKTLNMIL